MTVTTHFLHWVITSHGNVLFQNGIMMTIEQWTSLLSIPAYYEKKRKTDSKKLISSSSNRGNSKQTSTKSFLFFPLKYLSTRPLSYLLPFYKTRNTNQLLQKKPDLTTTFNFLSKIISHNPNLTNLHSQSEYYYAIIIYYPEYFKYLVKNPHQMILSRKFTHINQQTNSNTIITTLKKKREPIYVNTHKYIHIRSRLVKPTICQLKIDKKLIRLLNTVIDFFVIKKVSPICIPFSIPCHVNDLHSSPSPIRLHSSPPRNNKR